MEDETAERILRIAVSMAVDPILDLLQSDPHQFSTRGCKTCRTISTLAKRDFGCVRKAKERNRDE